MYKIERSVVMLTVFLYNAAFISSKKTPTSRQKEETKLKFNVT